MYDNEPLGRYPLVACDASTFAFNRTGVESMGLQQLQPVNASSASPAACQKSCCNTSSCDVWQWNPSYLNNHEKVKRPSCYGGKETSIKASHPEWQGASKTNGPPTPAPKPPSSTVNVWARPLQDGSVAIAFLNVGTAVADVHCDGACFGAILEDAGAAYATSDPNGERGAWIAAWTRAAKNFVVRDLWQRKDVGVCENCATTGYVAQAVPVNGAAAFKFTPVAAVVL
jgi:hypothetical protein